MKHGVMKGLLEALRANHQWHIDNDDHDGYPGSDLEKMNLAAIARVEAILLEKLQPDADDWIVWGGGECPLEDGVSHQVRYRDGVVSPISTQATWLRWWHWPFRKISKDIVAYRIVEGDAA